MSNSFLVGSYIRIQAAFRTSAGVLVNPTTVTLTVKDGAGTTVTTTTASFIHPSIGIYYLDRTLVAAAPGTWTYKWVGTGAAIAVNEDTFTVVATAT
jgi:hypothetical protein